MTDNNTRRFKLLRDLPDCKAGEIFTFDGDDSYRYESIQYKDGISWYRQNCVENNPEWFEEIKSEPTKEKERIEITLFRSGGMEREWIIRFNKILPNEFDFKKIKPELERVINGDIDSGEGVDLYSWIKIIKQQIVKQKRFEVAASLRDIEKFLNELYEPEPDKQWEILAFTFKGLGGIDVVCDKASDYYHTAIKEPSKHTIHSVRRLSDK